MVRNLAALGKTVLLTTHYMDEAQYLARQVAVIVAGLIVAQGPPSTLAGRDTGATVIRFRADGSRSGLSRCHRQSPESAGAGQCGAEAEKFAATVLRHLVPPARAWRIIIPA